MNTGTKIGLAILGILFLAPGACGGLFFGAALAEWLGNGFSFGGGPENYTGAFVIFAAPGILLSVLLLGILLRYLKWDAAPKASLVLAVVATGTAILSFAILFGGGNTVTVEDKILLFVACLAGFATAALPPFFHWRRG
ncbi:MAG: hypothetical protein WAU86_10015 [Oricola sp.]